MTRQPLQPDTIVEYAGDRARVIKDYGGAGFDVVVDGEPGLHRWYWCVDGEECTVVSVPERELPYITELIAIRKHNPAYGDERICQCGDEYYRHFDSYDNMRPIGCKYCDCSEFVEKENTMINEATRSP